MKRLATAFLGSWPLVANALAAIIFACAAPNDVFDKASQELIGIFGLLMAGVLPTMVLTASVLRAGNFSRHRIQQTQRALSRQMNVWIGLFFLCLIASVAIVAGKSTGWSIVIKIPDQLAGASILAIFGGAINFAKLLNAVVFAAIVLVVVRALSVGRGIISILNLNAEMALAEASVRDNTLVERVIPPGSGLTRPEGFGERISESAH